VITASGDGLAYCEPPLYEEVLPAVAKKQQKHRELAAELTLVVRIFDRVWSTSEVDETRSRLQVAGTAFRSIYLTRRDRAGHFVVAQAH
jgi:hypothetical protein